MALVMKPNTGGAMNKENVNTGAMDWKAVMEEHRGEHWGHVSRSKKRMTQDRNFDGEMHSATIERTACV